MCFRDVDWAYKAGYELRSALRSSENKKEKCGFVARTWKSWQLLNAIMDLWGLGDFYSNTCRAKTLTQSSVLGESKPQGRGMDLEPVSCSSAIMLCEDFGRKGGSQLSVHKGSPSPLQRSLRQPLTLCPVKSREG